MNLQRNQNLNRYSARFPDRNGNNPSFAENEDDVIDGEESGDGELRSNDLPAKLFGDSLPVQATSNDVRELVRFLKHKPSGLSLAEVLSSEPRRIFEPRKMEAYEYWGIISRSGERLILTALGNKLADIVASETGIFEEVLAAVPSYVEIIKWIDSQNLKLVTHPDITEFFNQLQKQQQYVNISEAEIVSFFSVCHAAELGVATVGKRGQPARLRVEPKRIGEFLARAEGGFRTAAAAPNAYNPNGGGRQQAPVNSRANGKHSAASLIDRVYVSVAPEMEIVESLSSALELADFESVVFSAVKDKDYLQSDKLHKMRQCQAGVIIIDDRDCHADGSGKTEIKGERLTEITAAAGLFDWRVVIVWDSLLPIPEYLENYSLHLLVNSPEDFRTSYQTVKLLKNMKYESFDSRSNS